MARSRIIQPEFSSDGGLATLNMAHEARGRVPSFVLPESFHPGEFLRTPRLQRRWDDARYFISLILRKLSRWDVDHLGLVRLHAKHLLNIMYQADYAAVVDALVDGGAVERFPYQVRQHSFGYRLAARFVADRHVRTPATDLRLIRRLEKFSDEGSEERQARMKPVHHALAKQQVRLQIHGNRAREILSGLPAKKNLFDSQAVLVGDIEAREFRLSVGQYGRVFNNISNLKRELRDELHVGGQRLGSVDLSCAQPAFAAKLIDETIKATDNSSNNQSSTTAGENRQASSKGNYDSSSLHYDSSPTVLTYDDLSLYRALVQSGEFYAYMIDRLRDRGLCISREVFKRRFLADVIAKKKMNRRGTEYQSDVEDCFRELFPTVYRLIREFNCQGWEHKNLVRLLQRAESEFVIETVAADLVTRFPGVCFVTLHDAIYAPLAHLPKVEQAFQRGFEQTGFRMKFKVAV